MGNIDAVFSEYDNTLSKNVKSSNLFDLLDASSLLWRLNVMGIDAGQERWAKVSDALAERAHNHRSPWLDREQLMGLGTHHIVHLSEVMHSFFSLSRLEFELPVNIKINYQA